MQNQFSADTEIVHVKGIFGVYFGYYLMGWFLQKWGTVFEQCSIVYFVELIESDLVHTEIIFFISS